MNRLLLRFSAVMIVVLVASSYVVRWGARHGSERYLKAGKLSELMASVDLARRRLTRVPPAQIPAVMSQLRREIKAPISLITLDSAAIPPEALPALRRGRLHLTFAHGQGRTLFLPLESGGQVLMMRPVRPFFHRQYFPTSLVLGAILLIILLAGLELALPIVRRLRRLEQAATLISEGEISARAEDTAKDAIGSLARRFNLMAERVQELLESQQQLIQAVAHELRTPLARMRFGLEMLSTAETPEESAGRQAALDEDLTELDELVEELLLYIRAGENALNIELTPVTALAEINMVVERARDLRPEITIQVEAAGQHEREILADPRAFRRAVQNLLANGIKVARERITVELTSGPEELSIALCDDGPGVPPEDRQRIFEPFTRLDQSRNRDSGGSGLGLAIVRRIVEAHAGSIRVEAAEGGGARFITTWRLAPPRRSPGPDRAAVTTEAIQSVTK